MQNKWSGYSFCIRCTLGSLFLHKSSASEIILCSKLRSIFDKMDIIEDSTNDSDISMVGESGLLMLNNSAIKSKIVTGEFKINNKRGRSKVWDVFGVIENGNGELIENLVACRSCLCVYKYNQKSTSNLVKHKCYILKTTTNYNIVEKAKINVDDKKNCVRVVTEWAVENCRPFKIVEDSGLKKFVQFLITIGAKYGANVEVEDLLPHPTTVSRNINNISNKYFEIIKAEIKSVKKTGYALTSDIWTDNYLRTAYISLTIHYVKEGKLNTRLLGLKSMKGESCTGQNIKSKICHLLSEFECDLNDMSIIVTDRANMIAAFRSLNNIFCINHLIHNSIEKTIKTNPQIADLIDKCTKLVKYFKKSSTTSSLQISLKSSVCTRWNTIYYLLDSIEKNWVDISNILQEKNQLQRIVNINLCHISALTKILRPFEETSKQLESENYATLHLTIVHIHNLKKKCSVNLEDLDIIVNFKTKLNTFLDSVVLENLTIIHRIALFLFPPANKLIQFNEDEKGNIKEECKRYMQSYLNEIPDQPVESLEQSLNEELHNLLSNDKALFADFIPPLEIVNSMEKVDKELRDYEHTNVTFYDDFNVLQWWHIHQVEFPLLFKTSCKILATPASSAPSERVFSSARQLISDKRSVIGCDPVLINQIMFLNYNVKKSEICTDLKEQDNNVFS